MYLKVFAQGKSLVLNSLEHTSNVFMLLLLHGLTFVCNYSAIIPMLDNCYSRGQITVEVPDFPFDCCTENLTISCLEIMTVALI